MSNLINLQSYVTEHGVDSLVTVDPAGNPALAIYTAARSVQTGRDFFLTEYARTYAEVREILGY